MKQQLIFISIAILILSFVGCVSAPVSKPMAKKVEAPAIDFGDYWTGKVRIEKKVDSGLGTKACVRFYSEWTRGEGAGIVYPKSFTVVETGDTVELDSKWENGGCIEGGVYDVVVDVDGMPGTGTIKNLKLNKGKSYNVYVCFNAALVTIPFKTDGDDLFVYPGGTFDKYEKLGRLDNIPDDLVLNHINSYNDNNPIWKLIPAGVPLDILRTYSNGDSKRIKNFVAVPESAIKKLP